MRESLIEDKVTTYADQNGFITIKLANKRGYPDRILLKHGGCMFMEFKQKGLKPNTQQKKKIAKLEEQGFLVFVVDSVEQGKEIIDEMV